MLRTLAVGAAMGTASVLMAAPASAAEQDCLNRGYFEIQYDLQVHAPGGAERVRVWPGTRGAMLEWTADGWSRWAIESGPTAGLGGWGPTDIFTIDDQGTC
jgi:hypothetical protein